MDHRLSRPRGDLAPAASPVSSGMPTPGEAIFAVAPTAGWVAHALKEYWVARSLEKYGSGRRACTPMASTSGRARPSRHPYRHRLPPARGNNPSRAGRLGSPV